MVMKAAIIVDIEVSNTQNYEAYIKLITPSVTRRGGRYLVRGGSPLTLAGDWQSARMVVIEFPSRALALDWLNDVNLQHIHEMRRDNTSKCNMLLCDMTS